MEISDETYSMMVDEESIRPMKPSISICTGRLVRLLVNLYLLKPVSEEPVDMYQELIEAYKCMVRKDYEGYR